MKMDKFKIKIFDDVSLGDILKTSYNNITLRNEQINTLMTEIENLLDDKIDYATVGPILNNFVDSSVKNNEQLMKLITTIHKLVDEKNRKSESGELLSQHERDELMKTISHEVRTYRKTK